MFAAKKKNKKNLQNICVHYTNLYFVMTLN